MSDTTLRFDLLANDRASNVFDKVGKSADDTESRFSKVGATLVKVGKAAAVGLTAGLGVAGIAAVKFAEAAAQDEQQAALLEGALKRNADATDGQVAATEKWITAQGRAFGVADDQLRPALSRLVTATHDVGKAQQLASLAMDVSAGSGKSLESVSTALMKAQNGQVSALSRLGINTKNAAGETISMQQAVQQMSDTFGGAAAEKAGTFQGQMDRLRLMMSETGEAIGYKLMPILTNMMNWVQTTAIPAVEGFFQEWQKGVGTAGQIRSVLTGVGNAIQTVAGFLLAHKEAVAVLAAGYVAYRGVMLGVAAVQAAQLVILKAQTVGTLEQAVVSKTAAAASKAWAAAQWVLNAALAANPIGLVIVALVALAAGLVIAYKKSETFRNIVDGAFTAVGEAGTWLWNHALQPAFQFIVNGIASIIDGAGNMLDALSHVPGFGWAKDAADKMHTAADAAHGLADSIQQIPSSKTVSVTVIVNTSAISKAQHQLDALGGIHGKMASGGRGAAETATASYTLGSLFAKNFAGGIKDKTKLALAAVKALTQRVLDKLNDLKDQAKQITSGVADAMKGALDVGSLGAVDENGVAADPVAQLANFAAQSGQFANALATAAANGLNSDLISKVAALGPMQGLTAAQALAAMDAAQVASANASMAAVNSFATQLGQTVLTTTSLPEDIARQEATLATLQDIKEDLKNNPKNITFEIHDAVDPDKVVRAIRKWLRQNGKSVEDI